MKISKFDPSSLRYAVARIGNSKFACMVIVLAALAAYHHSFSGPFIFDDRASITDNATIRSLWPPGPVFSPPPKAGSGGRPVFNLSLAMNYAAGGTKVRGYHAVNLAIHILAGLTLFGIMRRTLDGKFRNSNFENRNLCAFAVALLWTLHPLQTEAVTWVSGRAESLMGLFYLLTLYCFIRSVESPEVGGGGGGGPAPPPPPAARDRGRGGGAPPPRNPIRRGK